MRKPQRKISAKPTFKLLSGDFSIVSEIVEMTLLVEVV